MGYSGGNDYYNTQAWADAQAANDALQAAYAAAGAASDAVEQGVGTQAAYAQAAAAVTNALKNYTEATANGNDVINAPESHVDQNLTPGPQVYSEPETVFTPPAMLTPILGKSTTTSTPIIDVGTTPESGWPGYGPMQTPIDPGIRSAGATTPAPTLFKPALVIAGVILLAKWLS